MTFIPYGEVKCMTIIQKKEQRKETFIIVRLLNYSGIIILEERLQ